MNFVYVAEFRIDLGKAIPEVGDLVNKMNNAISSCGYNEQLSLTSKLFSINVTVNRELTEEDTHKMKTILESEYIKAFPKYDVRLASFGRKSVTPELSAK